jgi:AhpD family alkylhydroperoxidase
MSTVPYIQDLQPVSHADAQGSQKELLDTALEQVRFIPNMYANRVNAPAVLSTYLHGYGLFRRESGFTPAEQEVVFLAISRTNGCNYCTAAHSMITDKMSGVPAPVLQAIRSHELIPDARLSALFNVTTEMAQGLGQPSPAAVQAFLDAGYQGARPALYRPGRVGEGAQQLFQPCVWHSR